MPSVTEGSTRWLNDSAPDTGSQSSHSANTMINIGPSQKRGSATPATATPIAAESTAVPLRAAAATPRGIAIPTAMSSEATVSCSVFGSASPIAGSTFLWNGGSEVRSSPVAKSLENVHSCAYHGWSIPTACRSASRSTSEACSPSITSIGSPGTRFRNSEMSSSAPTTAIPADTRRLMASPSAPAPAA